MEIFRLDNFSFQYPALTEQMKAEDQFAIEHIDLKIEEGEFILLCGLSGSGKTTLLRQLKPSLADFGKKSGAIYFQGEPLDTLSQRTEASKIGFVQQDPENQVVTDKVWHEIAFGLESLGYDQQTIRLRVGEIASFFGMEDWFYKDVKNLSGGQLQMINLASILAMQPNVLLLDEPTSQLDPIGAENFLRAVKKVSDELGITVIISEHRLGEVYRLSDRVIFLDEGQLKYDGSPRDFGVSLSETRNPILYSLPIPTQVYVESSKESTCPISIGEGKHWVNSLGERALNSHGEVEHESKAKADHGEVQSAISLEHVFFRYEKDGKDVLKNVDLKILENSITCVLGGNGSGKTTLLKLLSGLEIPFRGKIYDYGTKRARERKLQPGIFMVPQNPKSLFARKSVREELLEMEDSKEEFSNLAKEYIEIFGLEKLLEQHPYDLSGGEQQRLAIAKVLIGDPKTIFLDEPTKGMDGAFKIEFKKILERLKSEKKTIVIVSHDLEFSSEVSDMNYLLFGGEVISRGVSDEFYRGNYFYTTAANKMCRQIDPSIITTVEAVELVNRLENII